MRGLLEHDDEDAGRDHADHTAGGADRWLAGFVIACAAGAAAVSLVLAFGTGETGGVAPGCGAGSGCAEVLGSRWSRVLGMKTAMVAVFTYALFLAATWPVAGLAGWQLKTRPLVRQALAAAIVGAAAWFGYLQAVEIGAFCKWCTTAHALGVLAAVGTFARDTRLGRFQPLGPVIGLLGAATLAGVQWADTPSATIRGGLPAVTAGAPAEVAADDPAIELLGGLVRIDLATTPAVGPADAAETVAVMLDYACPHCRTAHGLLRDRGVRLLVLPVPLNAACNPAFAPGGMPARFDDSCALAEAGIAAFLAGGEAAYAAFENGVFAGDAPPGAAGADALALAAAPGLTDAHRERARSVIAENAAAWARLGEAGIADRVPVLIDTASGRVAVGRLYGPDDLDLLLRPDASP